MGRPPVGKRAMTPAERQRRRREMMQLGITHTFLTREVRAWDALGLITAHLDSLEATNDTHTFVRAVWARELDDLLKREIAKLPEPKRPEYFGKKAKRAASKSKG